MLYHKACTLTATAVLILSAAVPGAAGIATPGAFLPTGSPTCTLTDVGGGAGTCTAGAASLSALVPPGVVGVTLSTSGLPSFSGGGTAEMVLSATGLLTGTMGIPSGTTIPLNYFFNLAYEIGNQGGAVDSWTLDFQLLDASSVIGDSGIINNTTIDNTQINSPGGQDFFGSPSLTTTASAALGDTLTERTTLDVVWTAGDSDTLIVTVPAPLSFDYGSTTGNTVPEPGTMGLMASSLALGAFYAWRRKKLVSR